MKRSWLRGGLVLASGAVAAVMILMYCLPLDFSEGSPVQPIIFSHKLHAGTNGIPCLYCHRYAAKSRLAGIPAVADCRACHLYISPEAPQIKKLMGYWARQEPIPWVRVNSLPDHVYFPHMMHIRAKTDCIACHGDVAAMERISRTASLKMGWCLDCHRQHKASIDCWTCHI
ncbi:MAG: cytochrome c3 family protein [Desulfuromonadaceae bacterium]